MKPTRGQEVEEDMIKPENPIGNGGRNARVADIRSAKSSGQITEGEFDSLMRDENTTANYIGLKRGALAALLLIVGFFFVISSI